MNKFIAGGCLLLSVLTLSCTSGIREKGEIGKTASVEQSAFSQEQVKPLYAQGFKLTYADQYLLADIQDPQNEESTRRLPDYKTSGQGIVRMFKSSQQRGLSGILTRFPFNPPPGKRDKRSLLQ